MRLAIPDRQECLVMLQEAGVEEAVLEHVQLVAGVALAFAQAINARAPGRVDEDLVEAGALLHDLGRARTHDIDHATEGVAMADTLGLDPRIVEIIRRHVGAGLTPGEARDLGLPPWEGMPRTVEEKLVCHADTLVGAHGRRTIGATLEHIRAKGAITYEQRARALHRELSELAGVDLDAIGPW